jgi:hypothetical protein
MPLLVERVVEVIRYTGHGNYQKAFQHSSGSQISP